MANLFTISGRARIARNITRSSAELKTWRLRNKKNKEFHALATLLTNSKGYIIASEKDLAKQYPDLFNVYTTEKKALNKLHIWAIYHYKDARGYAYLSFCGV
jgi:hypothetical protein